MPSPCFLIGTAWASACLMVIGTVGCSGRPARLTAPTLNPAGMAAGLVAIGDGNSDGSLTGDELDKVPALKSILGQLDADGDGGLSTTELRDWLQVIRDSRVAITSFTAIVKQRGKPLTDAVLRIDPLPPLTASIKPAEGRTDGNGRANPAIREAKFPGVNCGLYSVRIEGRGNDGRPLPARYNTESTLGLAVGAGLPPDGVIVFDLE